MGQSLKGTLSGRAKYIFDNYPRLGRAITDAIAGKSKLSREDFDKFQKAIAEFKAKNK